MLLLLGMSIPAHTGDQALTHEAPETPRTDSVSLRQHLLRAATAAAEENLDLDAFMKQAWQAFMEARPGLREQLEDLQLIAQVDAMRKAGKIGVA
jgi:hypothetical protein